LPAINVIDDYPAGDATVNDAPVLGKILADGKSGGVGGAGVEAGTLRAR
jgi:hypothetical protein